MNFPDSILVILGILTDFVLIRGFEYKCFRDICDSNLQFCNKEEERCSICTYEQCTKDVAYNILDQCEVFCQKDELTSPTPVTTRFTTTTSAQPQSSCDSASWRQSDIIQLSVMCLGFAFVTILLIIIVSKLSRGTYPDPEKDGTHNTSQDTFTVTVDGYAEKRPLLGGHHPIQANTVTHMSELDDNKVQDINILNDATFSRPPDYTTTPLEGAAAGATSMATSPHSQETTYGGPSLKSPGAQETLSPDKDSNLNTEFLNFKQPTNYQKNEIDVTQTRLKSTEMQ